MLSSRRLGGWRLAIRRSSRNWLTSEIASCDPYGDDRDKKNFNVDFLTTSPLCHWSISCIGSMPDVPMISTMLARVSFRGALIRRGELDKVYLLCFFHEM
ncbi:hypothetical protein VNO78_16072 [Psophocarpus tetragonolobus]|uniref:Uncharacterized protein n=1 Tax=Psophocarpus tetragonolobus TaxID=3891 RepID=A0AAN9SKK7_PSOTE